MSTKNEFLTFYIVMTDPAAVAALQQTPAYLAAGGINRAPYDPGPPVGGAAIEFAAPFRGYSQPTGPAPYIWTPWSGLGSQGGPYPLNVATFTRHTGGFWGIGGTTTHYYWIGVAVLGPTITPPAVGTDAPVFEKAVLAKRQVLEGFEIPMGVGFNVATNGLAISRDASRHVGGLGLAMRGATASVTIPQTVYNAANVNAGAWVRCYARLRRAGAGTVEFFRVGGTPSAAAGFSLRMTASGQLAIFSVDSGAIATLLGTVGLFTAWDGLGSGAAGWHRLDLLFTYNTVAAGTRGGGLVLLIDGTQVAFYSISNALGGLGQDSSRIQNYQIGNGAGTANTLDLDVDDFVMCDLPDGRQMSSVATFVTGSGPGSFTKEWLPYDGGVGPLHGNYSIGDVVITREVGTAWDATTAYLAGAVVTDGVVPYTALVPNTGVEPPNAAVWSPYAPWHVYKAIVATGGPTDAGKQPQLRSNGTYWNRYEGYDWINGSKIGLIKPTAFGSAHNAVGWGSGAPQLLAQRGFGTAQVTPALSSTTALAQLEADTDADISVDGDKMALGLVAFVLMAFQTRGTLSGNLGFSLNAVITDTAIVQAAVAQWNALLYTVDGATVKDPVDVTPFKLRHQKGNDAVAGTIRSILAMHELIGKFDQCDYNADVAVADATTTAPTFPACVGQHNAPYPYSPSAVDAAAGPLAPYIVTGGTYVGNGTGQDLTFRAPVHLLFIRPLTGGAGGTQWWSTMVSAHKNSEQACRPGIITCEEDPTFVEVDGVDVQQARYRVRLGGNDSQINANAVTYQYIAVSDPGARFMLNLALAKNSADTGTVDHPLIDSTYLAEFIFAWIESLDTTLGAQFYAQAPGGTAGKLAKRAGGNVTAALTPLLGKIQSNTNWDALLIDDFPLCLWRRADGNNDPGQPGVVAIGTWTGDGSASRTISLAPASGRRPLFAIVFSEQAGEVGFTRDPSNTGANSTDSSGVDRVTGITGGGIDSFSVGTFLNSNAVVYHYLVLFADATAGNGGWGVNGEYIPVEAESPKGKKKDPDPKDFVDPPIIIVPPVVGPDPDLSTTCVAFSQRSVNIALSHLGASKQVAVLATENTKEAVLARLHLNGVVDGVLRDFPWPFATRYANLVLVAGTATVPAVPDWQYSYRLPALCVMGRRIVPQQGQGRAFDPKPIPFRIGSDATGPLLYSNEPATTLVPLTLEYTTRPVCPLSSGDANFKIAVEWRLASALAMPLARDNKMQAYCFARYVDALARATGPAAREQQQEPPGDADWIAGR